MTDLSKKVTEILNHSINKFDRPVNELIKELKIDLEKQYADFNYWDDLEVSNPEKYYQIDEIANQTGHSLEIQKRQDIETAMFIEDELFALIEMKIIYAFKNLEINIKKLIRHYYKELPNSKPKWHEIERFLKRQNIPLNKIQGFKEVDELRLVNNSLKHSDESVDQSIMNIQEFKNGSIQNSESLDKFYERIEEFPALFFTSLMERIEKETGDFNQEKLERIAEKATNRMNKDIAEKLINEIRKKYK
ncbi:hypothetical protein [Winogradskyella tangerina]|uniref:hypothetical protein n=1 Tax=Winogradskyella tangerina TaxID=2023240 RepID=UPI000DBDFFF6|nr:hypothetical protein [Winogradskyella tangerina]